MLWRLITWNYSLRFKILPANPHSFICVLVWCQSFLLNSSCWYWLHLRYWCLAEFNVFSDHEVPAFHIPNILRLLCNSKLSYISQMTFTCDHSRYSSHQCVQTQFWFRSSLWIISIHLPIMAPLFVQLSIFIRPFNLMPFRIELSTRHFCIDRGFFWYVFDDPSDSLVSFSLQRLWS